MSLIVDPNITIAAAAEIIPVGPIASLVKIASGLLGGVFGVYLIILYLRWKEYLLMKKMLFQIRKDLRVMADAQDISLPPIKEPKLFAIKKYFKRKIEKKKLKKELEKQWEKNDE